MQQAKTARPLLALAAAGLSLIVQPVLAQSGNNPAQAQQQSDKGTGTGTKRGMDMGAEPVGDYPKVSFDTLGNFEFAGMSARGDPDRDVVPSLRFDSTLLVEVNDKLSIDGLFQFKPRQPRPAADPNKDLFINQGAGRREGGKMKELYVRYGDYRVGKFVQDFGRAYALLPGPYAADFIEEAEQGYERQLSVSAFMVDRTFLHESLPYNEGIIHYRAGGVANTRLPENIMVTFDNLNMPVGHWGQLTWQASVIRFGKSFGAERGERWATLGGDLAIPLNGSVASTLQGRYAQVRLYVEGAHRQNFNGIASSNRDFLSGSAEYLKGRWLFDLTTTRRWTTDPTRSLQKDAIYTGTVGYNFPRKRPFQPALPTKRSITGKESTLVSA